MIFNPRQVYNMYKGSGINVMEYLRNNFHDSVDESKCIEISYDFQTGSYVDALNNKNYFEQKMSYVAKIVKTILELCMPSSILEAGVGEATTLAYVAKYLNRDSNYYGFDMSWSRAWYARKFLHKNGLGNANICTGDLLNIPCRSNSIDVVYTSHSIEPNRGSEETILKELYRVTKKFLILLEPGYEFATKEGMKRMDRLGYCKNLKEISLSLGYSVIRHELFASEMNPLNPTAIIVIEKNCGLEREPIEGEIWACPKFNCPLVEVDNFLFSREALVAYPILKGIPCLKIENGIFSSKIEEYIACS